MPLRANALDKGAYFHDLLTDQTWIIRQVTSFEYLDLPSVSLRTSITVDGAEVLRRAGKAGLTADAVDFPLGIFPKSLFGSFDLTDSEGCAVPLLRSEYDSSIAVAILRDEMVSQGADPSRISPQVLDKLYAITSKHDGDNFVRDIKWILAQEGAVDFGKLEEIFTPDLFDTIGYLNDEGYYLVKLLEQFAADYIPIVQMRREAMQGVFVLKYREVTHSPEFSLLSGGSAARFIWTPAPVELQIDGVNLGLAGSQHFRASAPDNTVITDAVIVNPQDGDESGQDHLVHISPRWASLYTNFRDDQGAHTVRISIIPEARPLMFPAIAALLTSIAVLGFGAALEISDALGTRQPSRLEAIALNSSGSVIAMLLLLPSLYLLALVRRDQHGIASALLRYPRYAVAASAIVSLGAAVPAAFSTRPFVTVTLWSIAFAICLVVVVIVLRNWWCVEKLQKNAKQRLWNKDIARGGPGGGLAS